MTFDIKYPVSPASQTMQGNASRQGTTKLSLIHRKIVFNNLRYRYRRLLRLRIRALHHSTREVVLLAACRISLPDPPATEEEDLADSSERDKLPWLNRPPAHIGDSDRPRPVSVMKTQESKKESIRNDHNDVPSGAARFYERRTAMEIALNEQLMRLAQVPQMAHSSAWKGAFPGMLEDFIDHLDSHCCPPAAAPSPKRILDGPSRRADIADSERHENCVRPLHFDGLQDDIDDTWFLMTELRARIDGEGSCGWSRWMRHRVPGARASIMKSSGLGSPLVESCTPDEETLACESSWETWGMTMRPSRRVLVGEKRSRGNDTSDEGSENGGRQSRIRW